MSIKINYKNIISTKSTINLVLFVNENFNITSLNKRKVISSLEPMPAGKPGVNKARKTIVGNIIRKHYL